jgi:two-component system, NtrC family, sensor kinase
MRIHSLRARWMLLFFMCFFIPYGVLTVFSVSTSRGMMEKGTMDHLQNLVEVKETAIEQWLKERIADGKTLAESREMTSLDPKKIEPFLSLVKHFERASLEIRVFNLKGEQLAGRRSRDPFAEEEGFRMALRGTVFVSSPALDVPSLRSTVAIYSPIRDREGRPSGILRELLDLTYVSELISESKLGKTGKLFVVNSRGEAALHNKLKEFLAQGTSTLSSFKKGPPVSIGASVYRDYAGNEVVGSWKWIPGLRSYLVAEQNTEEAFDEINHLAKKAILVFIISSSLILALSYSVIGRATDPIKRLSSSVAAFAEGHFGKVPVTRREDEIGRLVSGFNMMADRLRIVYAELEGKVESSNKELDAAYRVLKQRQEQLVRSEKMAALGQLSAGIAHEVRTPLTSIKIFIQSLEKEIDPDESQRKDFRIILKEIDRINENITRFLDFARPEEPLLQKIDLETLVRETINLLAAKIRNSGIRLDLSVPDGHPPIEGDPKQLTQVLLNLLLNAIEAMPEGGALTIRSSLEADPDGGHGFLRLLIRDTGHGISEKDRPYLFDPFFTTKPGGTGLGLSIVYSIVQKHQGRVEVESEPGKGSSFILSFPVQKEGTWRESSLSMTTLV